MVGTGWLVGAQNRRTHVNQAGITLKYRSESAQSPGKTHEKTQKSRMRGIASESEQVFGLFHFIPCRGLTMFDG